MKTTEPVQHQHGKVHLRWLFLPPLAAVLVLFATLLTYQTYHHEQEEMQRDVAETQLRLSRFWRTQIQNDAETLGATMQALRRDDALVGALAAADRNRLLEQARPLFRELHRHNDITHLYFMTPERRVLLRVHQPGRYGDIINRYTAIQAEQGQRSAYGVELGPLGTLTLRYVTPWSAERDGTPLGLVEIGMEVDHLLNDIRRETDWRLFLLVDKRFLDRADWMAGMTMLGRKAEWNRYPGFVVPDGWEDTIPPQLSAHLARGDLPTDTETFTSAGHGYRVVTLPLEDVRGRPVARLLALFDVTEQVAASHNALVLGIGLGLGIGGGLFTFFFLLLSRVERRLADKETALERLATHDDLTGLYNHRAFEGFLHDELERSRRTGRPTSLLMVDIDHFKQVNDSYGHLAGDRVLEMLAKRLTEESRTIDRVCRYGGEEIAILLPEASSTHAQATAERMRRSIGDLPFDIGLPRAISLTISIGVGTFPTSADSEQGLIAAADDAMYDAKKAGRNRVMMSLGITSV